MSRSVHSLPQELLVRIFSSLSVRQKLALKYVCKRWCNAVVFALQQQKAIGIGTLSRTFYENIRFHSCRVHGWSLDTIERIAPLKAEKLLKPVKQADGRRTCPLYRIFPKLEVILIGSDVVFPDEVLPFWSPTLTCLCVQSRKNLFNWTKEFRLTCYRGRHVTRELLQSCPTLEHLYCENDVPAQVIRLLKPPLRFLTCDLTCLTDLLRCSAVSGLQSLNLNVKSPYPHSGNQICLLDADYIRIQIAFSKSFVSSFVPKKRLVKLILDFTTHAPSSDDLMVILRRVADVRQLSLQLVPGPNSGVCNRIIAYISETYQSLEELRIELPGASFDDSSLTSLSTLSNLTKLMIRDGDFHANAIRNFLTNSSSRRTLQCLILVSRLSPKCPLLTAEIRDMTKNLSLRDVRIV